MPLRRQLPTRPVAKRKQKHSVRAFFISVCIISLITALSFAYEGISRHGHQKIQARNPPWIDNRWRVEDIHNEGQGLVRRDAEVLWPSRCEGRGHGPFMLTVAAVVPPRSQSSRQMRFRSCQLSGRGGRPLFLPSALLLQVASLQSPCILDIGVVVGATFQHHRDRRKRLLLYKSEHHCYYTRNE